MRPAEWHAVPHAFLFELGYERDCGYGALFLHNYFVAHGQVQGA